LLSPPWNLTETLTKALTGARDRIADQDKKIAALRDALEEVAAVLADNPAVEARNLITAVRALKDRAS
jgi:chaperonin GroEL (HSP60 family)